VETSSGWHVSPGLELALFRESNWVGTFVHPYLMKKTCDLWNVIALKTSDDGYSPTAMFVTRRHHWRHFKTFWLSFSTLFVFDKRKNTWNDICWLKRNLMTLVLNRFKPQKVIDLFSSWIWHNSSVHMSTNLLVVITLQNCRWSRLCLSKLLARIQYC
jgi:hypothetical protein